MLRPVRATGPDRPAGLAGQRVSIDFPIFHFVMTRSPVRLRVSVRVRVSGKLGVVQPPKVNTRRSSPTGCAFRLSRMAT